MKDKQMHDIPALNTKSTKVDSLRVSYVATTTLATYYKHGHATALLIVLVARYTVYRQLCARLNNNSVAK